MFIRSVQIALLLTISCVAVAQQKSRQQSGAPAPASTDCAATFTSGKGDNATQFCVTENGNITQFSKGGNEYISVGDFLEGYGMCDDTTTPVGYYDYAEVDSGNWSAASFSKTASKAVSTRQTSDGIWQITNTITKVAANSSGPGAAKVAMEVRNQTATERTILLLRYADVDFSDGGTDDFINDFDYTLDTAFGLEPGFASGLGLTTNTFTFEHSAFAQNTSAIPDPCDSFANVAPQPFVGDGSIGHAYLMGVPANGSRTVVLTYKPI
jgi:hypothetical protein